MQQVRNGRIDEFRSRYRDQVDVLLVDDIQYLGGKERTQDEFFHTFNALFESHRQIVVTADKYPHEIPDLEDRIRSRFQWGLIADIQPPELETRIAILEKKALIDGIDLPSQVAHFLAANIKSNVRELEGLLIRVAAMASLRQQPITVEFAQETLKNFLGQTSPHLSTESVQKEVANYFGISVPDLCSASRQAKLARPAGRSRCTWPASCAKPAIPSSASASAARITRLCCRPAAASRDCSPPIPRCGPPSKRSRST